VRSSAAGFILPGSQDARRYAVVEAKRRLHEAVFGELVLDAYAGHCAISGLPERRLLHAAHILRDRDKRGLPVVSNGIAMSVIHHTAYDLNLLGIDADGGIHVNRDLLEIHDGPLTKTLQDTPRSMLESLFVIGASTNRTAFAEKYARADEDSCRKAHKKALEAHDSLILRGGKPNAAPEPS